MGGCTLATVQTLIMSNLQLRDLKITLVLHILLISKYEYIYESF